MGRRLSTYFLVCFFSIAVLSFAAVDINEKNNTDYTLENEFYLLNVDSNNGRIARIMDKTGQTDLVVPTGLADNFRLSISNEKDIFGRNQIPSSIKKTNDSLVLEWDGPLKDNKGTLYNIPVKLTIRFVNESIEFKLNLKNNSQYVIKEVRYPILSGLNNFGSTENHLDKTIYCPCSKDWVQPKSSDLPFGTHNVGYPEQLNMPFVVLSSSKLNRGIYFGSHDKIARYKEFQFYESGSNVFFNLTHFPYTQPGQEFDGSAVIIQFHDGGLIDAGKKIYRPWFKSQFGLMEPSEDWIRQQSFFQMIMMMLPEGNVNYTYKDIKQLAKDGLDYGITALQLAGWQRGGHDTGYPYYEPDPRLGTWEELQEGIRQCHEMGVKVYFFVNILPVTIDTQWYRDELKDYVSYSSKDCCPWLTAGWGMGTLASRLKYTRPLMTFTNPSFPKFSQVQLDYFKKLAEIGADGIHIDKVFINKLDWNPRTGTGPDTSQFEGTIRLIERIYKDCNAIRPGFRISFEARWDRVLTYGAATWWGGNMNYAREVFPEAGETVGLYMPYDYIGVNDAVRTGYAVMVSPHKFNRSMSYPTWKGLANYIKEVKRIRDELAETIFWGQFLHSREVKFQQQQLPANVVFSTFRNLKTRKRACILTNNGSKPVKQVLLNFEGNSDGMVRVYKPFEETATAKLPVEVVIESERIAFLVEQ